MELNEEKSFILNYKNRLKDLPLGIFFDEIFSKKLLIDYNNAKSCNIIERKNSIKLIELFPNEWKENIKFSDSSISRLRTENTGKKNDYSIGASIVSLFLDNPQETIYAFSSQIDSIIKQPEVEIHSALFFDYIDSIIELNHSEKLSKNLFDSKDITNLIKSNLSTCKKNNETSKVLALMLVSFIIIKYYGIPHPNISSLESSRRAALFLLWSTKESLLLSPSHYFNSDLIDVRIQYAYAKSFFEYEEYSKSFLISKKISTKQASPTLKAKFELLYCNHLIWGRGCVQDSEKAFRILTKQYDKMCEIAEKQGENPPDKFEDAIDIKKSILYLFKMISLGYIAGVDFDVSTYLSDNSDLLSSINPQKTKIFDVGQFVPKYTTFNSLQAIVLNKTKNSFNSCLSNDIVAYSSKVFLASLPTYYKNSDFYDEAAINDSVSASAYNDKKTIISLLSDNENTNIYDCISILNRLSNLMESEPSLSQQLSNNIEIYIKADYEFASTIINSNLSSFNNSYIRVHICDYNLLSARSLLYNAPLFIPCLIDNSNEINVVVFGNNDSAYTFIKEAVAVGYTGIIPRITLIGSKADYYKQKLIQECPGIFKEPEKLPRIIPEFYNVDLDRADYVDLFTNPQSKSLNQAVYNKLSSANYFVIDLGSDKKNLAFATKLRGLVLLNSSFTKTPFIAVKCESGITSDSVRNMVINNKKPGNEHYNNLNLYCYGMYESIFNSHALSITKNDYMRMGLNVHLTYCKSIDNPTLDNSVLMNYFTFSYNRDSSECKSISTMYLLFSLGIIRSPKDYKKTFKQLSDNFNEWIKNKDNLEKAMVVEHSRWVNFMLSRGWQSATLKQVLAYLGQESGKDHKHLLAKLHPFICKWDDFYDNKEQYTVIKEIENTIGLRPPYESTKEIILGTAKIMLHSPVLTIPLQSNISK